MSAAHTSAITNFTDVRFPEQLYVAIRDGLADGERVISKISGASGEFNQTSGNQSAEDIIVNYFHVMNKPLISFFGNEVEYGAKYGDGIDGVRTNMQIITRFSAMMYALFQMLEAHPDFANSLDWDRMEQMTLEKAQAYALGTDFLADNIEATRKALGPSLGSSIQQYRRRYKILPVSPAVFGPLTRNLYRDEDAMACINALNAAHFKLDAAQLTARAAQDPDMGLGTGLESYEATAA